ncbi:MAG: DUF1844 domain-containing protein [Terriglobia bacterium]|jgi:hypothetical protein
MADEKNDSPGFKVVDRRSFATGGERREEPAPQELPKPPAAAPPEPPPAAETFEDPDAEETGAPGFDTIISYLSTTAMFQLGLLAGPGGERIPPDLMNAHRTIDMLEILQKKTQGNLTASESQLLEEVLYELHMSYVAVQQRFTQKPR